MRLCMCKVEFFDGEDKITYAWEESYWSVEFMGLKNSIDEDSVPESIIETIEEVKQLVLSKEDW